MAFVVEDGTGLSDATSYGSVSDCDDYHALMGSAFTGTQNEKESALMLATVVCDLLYTGSYQGYRVSDTQALQWPRYGVYTADGYSVSSSVVPTGVKNYVFEIAGKVRAGEIVLADVDDPSRVRKEFVKVGPIEISEEYTGSKSTTGKSFSRANAWIAQVLEARNRAVRG